MTPEQIIWTVAITLAVMGLLVIAGVLVNIFMIKPGKNRSEMEKFKSVKFAHRGLHNGERAENSISAFAKAKEMGFGIEFDIRLSKDGVLVVHHDADLSRVVGREGKVIDFTAEELSKMSLNGTNEGIPTFREVLELIDGAVPLLIEIKHDIGESGVAERFLEEIKDYHGDYIVESFNPVAIRTVKRARPDILRGILSMEYMKDEKYKGKIVYRLLQDLRANFLMRPDFVAYDKLGYHIRNLRYIRRNYGTALFAWTVRSPEEEAEAISHGFDTVIFEGYIPDKGQTSR